jgi:hypothetical protein
MSKCANCGHDEDKHKTDVGCYWTANGYVFCACPGFKAEGEGG